MTATGYDAEAAADYIAEAHAARQAYRNLPDDLAPRTVSDAYAVQEALRRLWEPQRGPVAGLKIATTTKVMQDLMGIDHPCGGMIYAKTIHASPFDLTLADHMHVVVECELAVRVGRTLAKKTTPWTREDVRAEVVEAMAAFELIEDRNAVYKETKAYTLIADNAWNAGIVLGRGMTPAATLDFDGLASRLETGDGVREGRTDDPMGALAWIANLAVDRGRPLEAGQVVITGSVVATLPIAPGERFRLEIDGIGKAEMLARG
ncbi:MAG: fumarylacetoacetate hydrolase family protein [Hyphomicrobiaceae bacterium]